MKALWHILTLGFVISSCSNEKEEATTIEEAVWNNDVDAVANFLKIGMGPDLGSDGSGLLHVATGPGGGNEVLKLLLNAGAQPNFTDPSTGDSPLMNAAMWVDLESVRILVEAGANQRIDEAIELTGNAGGSEKVVIEYLGRALAEKNTAPTKVACVGDSITFGFGIKDREKQSYPAQLALALGDGWSVGNFGRNGRTVLRKGHAPYWKTQEYKKALALKPDIVIIKLGTNDLRPMNWEKHKAEYVPDYVDLIRSFQALESKPTIWICYPAPIYPGHEKFQFGNEVIRNELIPKIDEIAKQTGANTIDLNTALSDKKNMFPDKIHPNADGAKQIATIVSKAITKK